MLAALILIMFAFVGCGKSSANMMVLHCDNCGKEIEVPEDSGMNEDWILYCAECEKEKGLDTVVETVVNED